MKFRSKLGLKQLPFELERELPCCLLLASLRMSITSVANSWALNRANFCLPWRWKNNWKYSQMSKYTHRYSHKHRQALVDFGKDLPARSRHHQPQPNWSNINIFLAISLKPFTLIYITLKFSQCIFILGNKTKLILLKAFFPPNIKQFLNRCSNKKLIWREILKLQDKFID